MPDNVKPTVYEMMGDSENKPNFTSGKGGFQYWNGSFKEAITESKNGEPGTPFESVRFQDVSKESKRSIYLTDSDTWGKDSSYLTLTLKPGWQALFYVRTENNDFFEDNVQGDEISSDWDSGDDFETNMIEIIGDLESEGYPTIWVQDNAEYSDSRAVFGLDGDNEDYMSWDIDSLSANVGQSRVRMNNEQFIGNTEIDDGVLITMIWCRYWNPNLNMGEDEGSDSGGDDGGDDGDETMPGDSCPIGFIDNGYGICVPDPNYDDGNGGGDGGGNGGGSQDVEVSTGAVLLLIVGVIGTVYLAVKL